MWFTSGSQPAAQSECSEASQCNPQQHYCSRFGIEGIRRRGIKANVKPRWNPKSARSVFDGDAMSTWCQQQLAMRELRRFPPSFSPRLADCAEGRLRAVESSHQYQRGPIEYIIHISHNELIRDAEECR